MKKALVVDDHPVIRAAVKMLLQRHGFEVVLEAGNGAEALTLAREERPELIVLDIAMPKLDGLGLLQRLQALELPSRALVYTAHDPTFYSSRCMRNGALGYIAKTHDLVELDKAISAIMAGYTFFPRLPSSSVHIGQVQHSEHELIEQLSDRELAILQRLAQGMNNKDIAETLLLSPKTVSTYKHRLTEKLKVESLVHLRDFARRNDLI